jgi:rRNA maturation RNase YbeY
LSSKINFFNEEIIFNLKNKQLIKKWLKVIANKYSFKITELNYIFSNDNYIHKINLEYLQHNTFTDIITFDNSDIKLEIIGDIFISIDRVKENSTKFHVDFEEELHRVISHGLLHLCGFKDKTKPHKEKMRTAENEALQEYQILVNAT